MLGRLVGLVAALVAVLFSLPSPASAFPTTPVVTAHVYDGDHCSEFITGAVTERGPPAAYDVGSTYDSVDSWGSRGAEARQDAPAVQAILAFNTCAPLVQVLSATGTTGQQVRRGDGDLSPPESAEAAANTGTSLIGKSYGLGTVVESPGLAMKGFQGSKTPGHALNQIINRGVSPSMLRNTVANPTVVLRQGSGNYLHVSDKAAVVLRPDGQVVTAYGRTDFRQHVLDILADVG